MKDINLTVDIRVSANRNSQLATKQLALRIVAKLAS